MKKVKSAISNRANAALFFLNTIVKTIQASVKKRKTKLNSFMFFLFLSSNRFLYFILLSPNTAKALQRRFDGDRGEQLAVAAAAPAPDTTANCGSSQTWKRMFRLLAIYSGTKEIFVAPPDRYTPL